MIYCLLSSDPTFGIPRAKVVNLADVHCTIVRKPHHSFLDQSFGCVNKESVSDVDAQYLRTEVGSISCRFMSLKLMCRDRGAWKCSRTHPTVHIMLAEGMPSFFQGVLEWPSGHGLEHSVIYLQNVVVRHSAHWIIDYAWAKIGWLFSRNKEAPRFAKDSTPCAVANNCGPTLQSDSVCLKDHSMFENSGTRFQMTWER